MSVVVPVFRNRATVDELHRQLCVALEPRERRFEILFVNDACPEDSLSRLQQIAQRDARVGVIEMARNVGQQRAVMAGLAHARGSLVVVIDGDLQDPPDAIPGMLDALESGFDAVFAGRRGAYQPGHRMLTSRVFKRLLAAVTGVPRDAGGFVAMRRTMVDALLALGETDPYLVGMIGCTGLRVTSVPVERRMRASGSSSYSSWDRWRMGTRFLVKSVLVWKRGPGHPGRDAVAWPVANLWGSPFTSSRRATHAEAGDGVDARIS